MKCKGRVQSSLADGASLLPTYGSRTEELDLYAPGYMDEHWRMLRVFATVDTSS